MGIETRWATLRAAGRRVLQALALLALVTWTPGALALQKPLLWQAVDPTGTLGPAQAAMLKFEIVDPHVQMPPLPARVWLRWRQTGAGEVTPDGSVHQSLQINDPRVLHMQAWIDDPLAASGWAPVGESGLAVPHERWPNASRLPSVKLPPAFGVRTVLVSLQTELPGRAELLVLEDRDLQSRERNQGLLAGLYAGVGLVTVLTLVMLWASRPDAAVAVAAALMGLSFTVHLVYAGYGTLLLWPGRPYLTQLASPLLSAVVLAALPALVLAMARRRQRRGPLGWMLWALAVLPIGLTVLALGLGGPLVARMWLGGLLMATLLGSVLASALLHRRGNRHVRPLMLAMVPGWLGGVVQALLETRLLTLQPDWMPYARQIGMLVSVPLVLWVMQRYVRELRELRVQAVAESVHDPVTGLIHERVARGRLERMLMRNQHYDHASGLLLVELTNLDEIQDEHGRTAAETALRAAADRVSSVSGELDTVARWGAQRYLLLVEGPCHAHRLGEIATRVVAAGLVMADGLPHGVALRFKVAVALVTPATHDPESLTRRASDALDGVSTDMLHTIRWVDLEESRSHASHPLHVRSSHAHSAHAAPAQRMADDEPAPHRAAAQPQQGHAPGARHGTMASDEMMLSSDLLEPRRRMTSDMPHRTRDSVPTQPEAGTPHG